MTRKLPGCTCEDCMLAYYDMLELDRMKSTDPWGAGLFDRSSVNRPIKGMGAGKGPLMDEDICFEEHMNEPNYWKTLLKTCPPATQKTSTF